MTRSVWFGRRGRPGSTFVVGVRFPNRTSPEERETPYYARKECREVEDPGGLKGCPFRTGVSAVMVEGKRTGVFRLEARVCCGVLVECEETE